MPQMTTASLLTDSVTAAVHQADTPKVDQMYQMFGESAREFVNKNFYNSYELIRQFFDDITTNSDQVNGTIILPDRRTPHGLPLPLWIKVWSLYLAILDAACKQAGDALLNSNPDVCNSVTIDSDEWNHTRKILARKLTSGSAWEELAVASGGTGNIHPTILALLTSLSIRHETDPKLMADNLEKFIVSYNDESESSETDDPKAKAAFYKVLDLYLLRVLPDLQQWDVSHSFVKNTTLFTIEQKQSMTERLEQSEKDATEEYKKQMEEVARQEKEVAEKELHRQKEQQQLLQKQQREVARSQSMSPSASNPHGSSQSREIAKSRTPRTLSQIISTSFKSQFDGNALFRTVALVVIVSLSAANPLIRKRVVETLKLIWVKIMQTLSMGFKVSYL